MQHGEGFDDLVVGDLDFGDGSGLRHQFLDGPAEPMLAHVALPGEPPVMRRGAERAEIGDRHDARRRRDDVGDPVEQVAGGGLRRIEAFDAHAVARRALHLPGHVLDVTGQEHALLDQGCGDDALLGRGLEARAHTDADPGLEPSLGDQPGLHRFVVDDGLCRRRDSATV